MSQMFPKCQQLPIPPRKHTLLTEPSSNLQKTDFIELHNDHVYPVQYEEIDAHEQPMEEHGMDEESLHSCGCSYHLDEVSEVECVPCDMMPVSSDQECDRIDEHQRTSQKCGETFVQSKIEGNVVSLVNVKSSRKKPSGNKSKIGSVLKRQIKEKVIMKKRLKIKTVGKKTKKSKNKNQVSRIRKQCKKDCKCQECKIQQEQQINLPLIYQFPQLDPSKVQQKRIKGTQKRKIKNEGSCHCKKTMCLKKYCDCFCSGKRCGNSCKCQNCQNIEE